MTHSEKRIYLIKSLLAEQERYADVLVPEDITEQKNLLRALMNVRMPSPVSNEFLSVQDEYLKEEISKKGITYYKNLTPIKNDIFLWQGDITTLRCDAIVNAANSGLTGCYKPLHNCIDNCIHTFAGIELRNACDEIIKRQGYEEATGQAKITPAFNLPSRYVIHTVGPIVNGTAKKEQEAELASCYTACLDLAEENSCKSIAFCCISTGVFGFPQKRAAQIATHAVSDYKSKTKSKIEVIFNVFKDSDLDIYRQLLG